MPAAQRRELILDAATGVFGDRGYHGTTTDQIAKAAGISQPYVVRLFGTKEKLFLDVLDRALQTMLVAFRAALADDGSGYPLQKRLGETFVDLVSSKGVHRTLLQAFVSGGDAEIGRFARAGFLDVFRFLRDEAGFTDVEVDEFLAQGMLFSVLLSLELPRTFGTDPDGDALMRAVFGAKCAMVLDVMGPGAS
ncbi:TetR family transcriptional regulator [Frondihabitans cladoniiphilus]|uniref:TetR family transcriptional regulator n=2 Tax=Frondihabitans cladoniiphilus TaxID=715785 RepID=A0ABP8W0U6_9MICO